MGTDSFPPTSEDAVLGGRLRLRQPLAGHRVGHDAILLAAATGGHAGELAVDLGAGVGAAGLALAVRANGLKVVLVEIDPALAQLAGENVEANRLGDRVRAVTADVEDVAALAAIGLSAASADRVLMNPPFHDAAKHQVSPDKGRRLAHAGDIGLLQRWAASAAVLLRPGGVLTLIWRGDEAEAAADALRRHFGALAILPVLPRADMPPVRLLMRAIKGGSGKIATLPPLLLNEPEGKPSAAAEAVLRHAAVLPLANA